MSEEPQSFKKMARELLDEIKKRKPVIGPEVTVVDSARILDRADVRGRVKVKMNATIRDSARVQDWAVIGGRAVIRDNVFIRDNVWVDQEAVISENVRLVGSARITERAQVSGYVRIDGGGVRGDARVSGISSLTTTWVTGNARVYGRAVAHGAHIGQDADVFEGRHVIVLSGLFPDHVTVYRTNDGPRVQAGCQNFALFEAWKTMTELAEWHNWELPPSTEQILEGLRAASVGWVKDTPR